MVAKAVEGRYRWVLLNLLIVLLREMDHPRPPQVGAPREYLDWQLAVMAIWAILAGRPTKSAQYRYLSSFRDELVEALHLVRWPSRSTYF